MTKWTESRPSFGWQFRNPLLLEINSVKELKRLIDYSPLSAVSAGPSSFLGWEPPTSIGADTQKVRRQ